MHTHSRGCRTRGRYYQEGQVKERTPLLDLPGEIREKIYRYALTKPEPINLWPNSFHPYMIGDSDRERRSSTLRAVRNQHDLLYVRKEMATGLLGTCRMVYDEAAYYFWSENTFRFSGKGGWHGLLRFLLTIGPNARARIRRLDVHAPMYMLWPGRAAGLPELDVSSKSIPKMHMAKITDEIFCDNDSEQDVCHLLARERTLEELNFIIPAGFGNTSYSDCWMLGDDLEDMLDFVDFRVVVEQGAYLYMRKGPQTVLKHGYDLTFFAGSAMFVPGLANTFEKVDVIEEYTWRSPARRSKVSYVEVLVSSHVLGAGGMI